MPNFILQFMEQYHEPIAKLNYLQMLTNDAQDLDTQFISQLYVILLKLIDTQLRPPILGVLAFIQSLIQNHPQAFSETQTIQLLLRISLAGVISLERKQLDIAQEVFQILQFFLKYNDYSPKLLNICLYTMCILSNRDPLTYPVWHLLRHLIIENETFIFQEIVGILQIQSNLSFWQKNQDCVIQTGAQKGQPVNQQQALRKEIQFKCFKGDQFDSILEINDLFQSFALSKQNCDKENDHSFSTKSTLSELVCHNECSTRCYENFQHKEVVLLDQRSSKALQKDIQFLIKTLNTDMQVWTSFFEKNIDKVYKGAVFFIGKVLWGNEKIEEIHYPVNQILKFFSTLITTQTKYSVLNEVLTATKMLILNTTIPKYFEWSSILSMLDSSTAHIDTLAERKRFDLISEILRVIKGLLMIDQFPEYLIGQALKVYMKYKNARAITDKTLTQLAINYSLRNDFMNSFEPILDSCLLKEKSVEIRTLFLDMMQEFYAETEDLETCNVLEAIFLNNLEFFYLTRVEGSFTTAQMIQIIDILTYMGHKTEKSASFKHIIEILEQCILCYDFDKTALGQEQMRQPSLETTVSSKQILGRKDIITQVSTDLLKMKIFQSHALNRMIQLFILKGQSMTESEKSVYVYNILLKILKVSANDRKHVICSELLDNIRVNAPYRELCWIDEDNPFTIEIQSKNNSSQLFEDATRQSCDSQGNSSGGSDRSSSAVVRGASRTYGEQVNAANNRSSLDKVGQDKQIIQSTLKTLLNCFEDIQTSTEIRLHCLKLFHKFMIFISDEDFNIVDYSTMIDDPSRQGAHLRQPIIIDNKGDWVKMIITLIKHYNPINQPEFSLVIIDIFYSVIGLDSYYKLLPQSLVVGLVEELLETLFLISNHLHKSKNQEVADALKEKKKDKESRKTQLASFIGQDMNSQMAGEQEDFGAGKILIKVAKKVVSLLGFIFTIDSGYGSVFWNLNAKEALPYTTPTLGMDQISQNNATRLVKHESEIKLIEYFVDQISAMTLNNQIMFTISYHILIAISNLIKAMETDPGFQMQNPGLIDSLIFINVRIMLPFMLNIPELSDPVYRVKQQYHKMNKSLKEMFRLHYYQFKVEDKFYIRCLTLRSDFDSLQKHLLLSNFSKLLQLRGVSDESMIQPILILLGQYENDLASQQAVIEGQNRGRSKEIMRHEAKLRQFLECVAQNTVWISHSVYDRNCNTNISLEIAAQGKPNGIHHYVWNKNILTLRQFGTKYDIIIRNAVFNYRAMIETQNKLQQSSSGNSNQISKMRNLLMRQSKGRSIENLFDQPAQLTSKELEAIILNDATLMSLIDPNSHYMFKKSKELLSFIDDQQFRSHVKALDQINPKNFYSIGVTYVPRGAQVDETLKTLIDVKVVPELVSENHLYFLSMLGQTISIAGGETSIKDLNSYLYLKFAKLDRFKDTTVNLIVNEDESDFIFYVSNVLNDSKEVNSNFFNLPYFSKDRIQVIYNESNIQDFTQFDDQKIYLVFSKLNDVHYLMEVQHARDQMNATKVKDYVDPIEVIDHTRGTTTEDSKEPIGKPLKKYRNGHLSQYAIVSQDKIGEWVKHIAILSDMFDKNQRHKNRDFITSNIMQRYICIKEFKNKLAKFGKPITILKQ